MSKGRNKGRKASKRSVAHKGAAITPQGQNGGVMNWIRHAVSMFAGGEVESRNLTAVSHGQRYKDNYGREYIKLASGQVMRVEKYAAQVDRQAVHAKASAARRVKA